MNGNEILDEIEKIFPEAHCELNHQTPFQLLVAVVLSAQTTDASVNKVTPALFEKYPDCEAMSKASASDIEPYIRQIGLYRNKARSLSTLSKELQERFNGEVPSTYKELQSLPGVGRKTANVVRGNVEAVDVSELNGRTVAVMLVPYPPGIPVLMPGDVITKECIDFLQELKAAGLPLRGLADGSGQRIRVI